MTPKRAAEPPAVVADEPTTTYGRELARYLDEMPPDERAVVEQLAELDRAKPAE